MMRAMRLLCPPTELVRLVALAVALAACANVAPPPEQARADWIPAVSLSAAERTALDAHVELAVNAVIRRRYDQAESEAKAALAIDPRCARARSVLGMVLLQRANLQDPPDLLTANSAETETLLAEQMAPQDAFVGWMRAVFLAESGHMSAAASAAEAALERTTEAPPAERAALFGIAGTYRYELGEERAALPHLQTYIGLRPDDATASFRIGWCLLRLAEVPQGPTGLLVAQHNAEAAARAFARCGELAPGDEDAALAVGTAFLRASELAEKRKDQPTATERRRQAEQQFRDVATRFPANAEAMFRIGVLAEQAEHGDDAQVAYGQALDRDQHHLGSLLNLAALLDTAGKQPESDLLLARALQVDAENGGLTAEERARLEQRLHARSTSGS